MTKRRQTWMISYAIGTQVQILGMFFRKPCAVLKKTSAV
jgi:hypothetical protein